MSGAESLKDVALRPWPTSKKEMLGSEDLMLQIEQLTSERGHLRNITEKSLQDDVIAGKDSYEGAVVAAEQKEDGKEDAAQEKEKRIQDVFRAQQEMTSNLEWCKFAANNLVDVISMALSVDPNRRSVNSFTHTFRTEGLSQGVPFGSFGMSRENHEQHVRKPDEVRSLQELEQRQELVAKGARMEALDTATDEILKAAKKLEREVRRETKYWQEVVSISDKGWQLQRLRQNARNVPFAVRYGLPEASNHFRARGLAPLRMDKDGSIILDPALALKPKTLRVRISENGQIRGTSCLPVEDDTKDIAIEKTIQLARDSLFEEELYHEMSLESRHLLAYGVEFRDSVIRVDASGTSGRHRQRTLLIDCIPLDEQSAGSQDNSSAWLAHNVAEGLRLSLAHEHSMRLYRRSQLPPPLSGQKREQPPPPLLRPLLAIFRHLEDVDSLYSYLEAVARTLGNAGFKVNLETMRETAWAKLAESLTAPSSKSLAATDRLLEIFLKPFEGRATLSLPSPSATQADDVIVSTRTVIGQPSFGTEHRLTLPASLATDLGLFQLVKFSSVEEITTYLDWILALHIAHRCLKSAFSTRAIVKANDPRLTIRAKGSKKGLTSSREIAVAIQHGTLKVTVTTTDLQDEVEEAEQSYTWNSQESTTTLEEQVKGWVG
ncbi:subunit 17 of mediator complex-domain-containing protein [Paraphoma chrysanthemicola]|nr:subunit 17 of mediator complex-domain-containing protein [Paraphoma chrysanthemicola]